MDLCLIQAIFGAWIQVCLSTSFTFRSFFVRKIRFLKNNLTGFQKQLSPEATGNGN